MSKRSRTIALDFDGVLHRYQGFRGGKIDGPIKGARRACHELTEAGHELVVFSTRDANTIERWLEAYNFPPMRVTNVKEPFWVIVDDRAVPFHGRWGTTFLKRIKKFKPYWIGDRPAEAEFAVDFPEYKGITE